MAKKGILRDTHNIEILPVTRGELILDSSGEEAFHSNEFLVTNSKPGLMSAEDKEKLNTLTKIDVDSELKLDSENPVQNKIITAALENKADISDNLVLAEGMKNTKGITFNLPNSSDEETQVLATQEDVLRIVANSDEVYIGDEIPEDDNSIKMWVDTDAGFDYSGNIIEVSGGASIYTIYTNSELSADQQLANKEAFKSVVSGEEAVYYVSVSEKDYIASYTLYNNTAIFTCSNVEVTSDGGNLMSIIVSINEDGSIATLSVQEGTVPNLEYINDILDNKGASIPVVASEQELENLSQSRGGVAVILSDNSTGRVTCHPMDLYQASMLDLELAILGHPLPDECSPISGINIDDSTIVEEFQGGVMFLLGSRSALLSSYFGLSISEEGEVGFAVPKTTESLIATIDPTTGVVTKFQEEIDAMNETLSRVEDLVWVYGYASGSSSDGINSSDALYKEAFKQATPYLIAFSDGKLPGEVSFRIKGDTEYRHLDSDVIRVLDQSLLPAINSIEMPVGSTIKVFVDEHTEYDTDWCEFTGAIGEGADADVSNATIIDDIEFLATSAAASDFAALVPTITICSEDLTSELQLVWSADETSLVLEVQAIYNGGDPVSLLHEGVWNEEGITYVKELLSNGCNRLVQVSKGGTTKLYDTDTGILAYKDLQDDPEHGAIIEAYLAITLTCYLKVKANKRIIPATVDTYERYPDAWKKQEVMASTIKQWTDETVYSELPPSASLVAETFDQYFSSLNAKQAILVSGTNIKTINNQSILGSGNIQIEGGSGLDTVDSELSTSSTNPVQNKVITGALNNKVSVVSGKGLSTNDYTTSDKNKLAGIAAGAEVNVQSDWNATSGDALILNKPVFATINGNPIDQGGNITVTGLDDPTANDSLQDIIKFLEGTIEEQTLAGIIENLQNQINTKQFTLVNGESIKTVNGQNLLGGGNIDTIGVIDDQLKDNSTNPVQNKVIKEYVDTRVDEIKNIGTLATITSVDTTNEVDDVLESLLDEISGETIQYINQINGEII